MAEITDLAQMKAVATAAKSYTLDKATETAGTIINALGGASSGSGGLLNPNLRYDSRYGTITWDGDGVCKSYSDLVTPDQGNWVTVAKGSSPEVVPACFLLESDGTYARDWVIPE